MTAHFSCHCKGKRSQSQSAPTEKQIVSSEKTHYRPPTDPIAGHRRHLAWEQISGGTVKDWHCPCSLKRLGGCMTIRLDHTIVPAKDKVASAKFFAEIFGLTVSGEGHFVPVKINESLTFDFADEPEKVRSHHYAFHV